MSVVSEASSIEIGASLAADERAASVCLLGIASRRLELGALS